MDVPFMLRKALSLHADRTAVIDGATRWTYEALGDRVARCARALGDLGVARGDRVAIIAPNCAEFLVAYFGAAFAGAILTPINVRLTGGEIARILDHSEARALVAHARFGDGVRDALDRIERDPPALLWIGPRPDLPAALPWDAALDAAGPAPLPDPSPAADEPAHLYYTSGTTGAPKGVVLTHGNVGAHALAAIAELGLDDATVWLHAAPLFHLADAWATFAVTWVGGRHVCLDTFTPAGALDALEREGVTITNLVPTMLKLMVEEPGAGERSFPALETIMSGGAPIAPETVRRVLDVFHCRYVQTYGMTETSPYLTVSLLTSRHAGLSDDALLKRISRTGRPFLGVELRVARPDGSEVDHDDREVGEILARGPTVTPGYFRDPAATAAAFTDGWLHTGDLAVIDAEGWIDIVDRAKDTIITGGENVYSTEVEHVLYEHEGVLEAAVVGVPDERWGEAVTAVVVRKPGAPLSADELRAFARERLAAFKVPKSVRFVDELPKTGSGKISKREIRASLLQS